MPEGHTIHFHMRRQERWFGGQTLSCSSPQGRFDGGAERLDGRVLARTEAKGKHAFWHMDDGTVLHVHLGLYGRYRYHKDPVPEPKGAVRLRAVGDARGLDLIGPTRCRLLTPEEHGAELARLGEDPLREDADPAVVFDKLGRTRRPIGATLLDQSIIAGIGNVYRAEILFVLNLDPAMPSKELSESQRARLWQTTVTLLRVGAKHNAIRVVGEDVDGPKGAEGVDPTEFERPGRYGTVRDRLWVYKRTRCKLCGTEVRTGELANRTIYWCPTCQAR